MIMSRKCYKHVRQESNSYCDVQEKSDCNPAILVPGYLGKSHGIVWFQTRWHRLQFPLLPAKYNWKPLNNTANNHKRPPKGEKRKVAGWGPQDLRNSTMAQKQNTAQVGAIPTPRRQHRLRLCGSPASPGQPEEALWPHESSTSHFPIWQCQEDAGCTFCPCGSKCWATALPAAGNVRWRERLPPLQAWRLPSPATWSERLDHHELRRSPGSNALTKLTGTTQPRLWDLNH